MKITLTFDTASAQDAQALASLLGNLNTAGLSNLTATAQPEVACNPGTVASAAPSTVDGNGVSEPVAANPAPAASEIKKRGRVKPEMREEAESESEPQAEPQAEQETELKPYTIDDVRAALQQFTGVKGVPAGIALLKEFDAGRISELNASEYSHFISRCAV